MPPTTLIRQFFWRDAPSTPLSLAEIYAAVALRLDEARRLWIERVRLGRADLKPLKPATIEANRRKGYPHPDRPLVGTGKWLDDLEHQPIEVVARQIGQVYEVRASVEDWEGLKVLREGRSGDRQVSFNKAPELPRDPYEHSYGLLTEADPFVGLDVYTRTRTGIG